METFKKLILGMKGDWCALPLFPIPSCLCNKECYLSAQIKLEMQNSGENWLLYS